ncbi:MAG: hypothetical protein M1493_05295 [Firmicutes bacterium]|nr:hypothetical protein [Bacillota bacterium]
MTTRARIAYQKDSEGGVISLSSLAVAFRGSSKPCINAVLVRKDAKSQFADNAQRQETG